MGTGCGRCKSQFESNESLNFESHINPALFPRNLQINIVADHQKQPSLKQINLDLRNQVDYDIQRLEWELFSDSSSSYSSILSSPLIVESPFKLQQNKSGQTITILEETYEVQNVLPLKIDKIKEKSCNRERSTIEIKNDLILQTDNLMRVSSSISNRQIQLRVKQIDQQVQKKQKKSLKTVEANLINLQKRKLSQQTENESKKVQLDEKQKQLKTQSILKVNGSRSPSRLQSNSIFSCSNTQKKKKIVSFKSDQVCISDS